MIITHKLKMNLEEGESFQRLEMPQGDVNTRQIELLMYARQSPWEIPAGVTVLIRYQKPDGTRGEYDTLPDGTAAWAIAGNALTLSLAPQVLTVPGDVQIFASLYLEEKALQTFVVDICVKAPFSGRRAVDSQDYYYVTNVLRGPVMAQPGQVLAVQTVDAGGSVTQVAAMDVAELVKDKSDAVLHKTQTLTDAQKMQARANIGAASQLALDYLNERVTPSGFTFFDERTGDQYHLFVSNGKLMMEKE